MKVTPDNYQEYLAEVEGLIDDNPSPESAKGLRLVLLAKTVDVYEKERFVFMKPSAEELEEFRKENANTNT